MGVYDYIDGSIKITVMEIQNGQVRFGINAPKEVKVYREEIVKRMEAEIERGKDAAWITRNEIMANPEAAQIPTIESLSKAYVDPVTAQIIIEQLADLKRKTAIAEEQLLILRVEAT